MQAFVLRVCFEAHHVCYYLCVCVCLPQSSTFVSKAREQLFVCRLFVSKQQRARQKKRQTPLCNLAPPLSWLVSAALECSGGRGHQVVVAAEGWTVIVKLIYPGEHAAQSFSCVFLSICVGSVTSVIY